jgi:hypothetical protein
MKEIAMLDLQRVRLRDLAEALEDHSPETSWWFDPDTGASEPWIDQSWFAFHDARMERRAIEWLAGQGLVERGAADRELNARQDPELPIDLLVVLDTVDSPWEELRRMDELLWRHSYENDAVISAVPVAERALDDAADPLLIRAQAEGRAVA